MIYSKTRNAHFCFFSLKTAFKV